MITLKELNKYQSLGTIDMYEELLYNIFSNRDLMDNDLHKSFLHNDYLNYMSLRGALAFLEYTDIIIRDEKQYYKIKERKKILGMSREQLIEYLIIATLDKLDDKEEFFINHKNIKFDSEKGPYILQNKIPLKYASIRNILISMEFFVIDASPLILYINKKYQKTLKKYIQKAKKKIALEEFKRKLENQEEIGLQAELFVLNFEKDRIKKMDKKKEILHISPYDVGAGYDILSLNSAESIIYDRFIEVKVLTEKGFYWSENETKKAKELDDKYYIYFVDLSSINNSEYKPIIIQNPYQNIFLSENWIKNPINWKIIKCR